MTTREAVWVISTVTHVTLRLPAAPPVSWCLWWSPLLLQTSLNGTTITRTDMDSSFIHLLKIDTSARIFFYFLYFRFFCLCQSEQHLYISPKNRPKELCPKECVYKLPINTLNTRTHAHARTHARQQCTSPCFLSAGAPRRYLSDTLPPLGLVEARLAQVSVAKTKQKIKSWMLPFFPHILFL